MSFAKWSWLEGLAGAWFGFLYHTSIFGLLVQGMFLAHVPLWPKRGTFNLEPSSPVSFLSLHVANGLAQAVIVSFCSAPVFSAYIVFVARAATYDANVRCRSSTKPGTGKQNTATQHTRMAANCACCLPCHLPGFMPWQVTGKPEAFSSRESSAVACSADFFLAGAKTSLEAYACEDIWNSWQRNWNTHM